MSQQRTDAFWTGYLDQRRRLDEWDPDQPRDEKGMFASDGGGTVAGAVKSGEHAIGKATSKDDLQKLEKSIKGSKVLDGKAKGALFHAMAEHAAANKLGTEVVADYKDLAGHYGHKEPMSEHAGTGEHDLTQEEKDHIKSSLASNDALHAAGKDAHAKAARESAKKIVEHAKAMRAAYKANPTKENEAKVKAAELAGKAARSAARKAEKSTSAQEAQKHAEKAHAHVAKLIGGDADAHAFVVTKAGASPKAAGEHAIDPTAKAHIKFQHDKLLEGASKEPPAGWSPEKHEAMAAAKKALDETKSVVDAPAPTPAMLKNAADKLQAVAEKAQKAGSYWGSGYSTLADQMKEAATTKEHFEVSGAKGDVKTHVPDTSHRPIESIKGEEVPISTFKAHREKFGKQLTDDEKKAALSYSGSGYSHMNSTLRAGGAPDKKIHDMDKAIAKAPAPRDMIVHRGMDGDFVHSLFSDLKPGDSFVEKGYTSTSAGDHAAFGGKVKMVITIPKGYPVAPIPSHHPGENEYVVRRNTRYHVTKIEKTKSDYGKDQIVAHLTAVHDEPSE